MTQIERRRRSLARRCVKWGGLLIIMLWLASGWISVSYSTVRTTYALEAGCISVSNSTPPSGSGWGLRAEASYRLDFTSRTVAVQMISGGHFGVRYHALAVFVLPIGLISMWLWLLDWARSRYPRPGHCRYNLTGNVSGICSECGRSIDRPPSTG